MIDQGITAFWTAWPAIRPAVESEIEAGQYGVGTTQLTELLEAIEPNLEWELMPGHTATHALCVSAAADPRLRLVTERWRRAAPASDDDWEYHAARISTAIEPLEFAEYEIDPRLATVGIEPDANGESLDLMVGHPDFAGLDEALQLQAVFRFLDDLLGEDGTERWVGSVDVMPDALSWGIPFDELRSSVELLADAATGEQWEVIEQFDVDLGNSELVINRALKRLDHLDLIMLISISVEIPDRKDVSLPDAVEADLAKTLGTDGVIFARETYDTFVVLYAYGRASTVPAVNQLPQRHGPAVYDVVTEADPGWDAYDEMR